MNVGGLVLIEPGDGGVRPSPAPGLRLRRLAELGITRKPVENRATRAETLLVSGIPDAVPNYCE